MATSRTGTAKYKRNSARVLHAAQVNGITHCPRCRVPLDYTNRTRPNGASVDHVLAWDNGGTDDLENLAILCLRCNSSIGNKSTRKKAKQAVQGHTAAPHGDRRPGRPA